MSSIPRQAADRAHADYVATRARLLDAVADLAESETWREDGAATLASWMAARWQESLERTREFVRDAKALRARPPLGEAMRRAEVSVDQCKALATLTREGNDDAEVWLESIESVPLEELQREARKAVARRLEDRDDGIYFKMRRTADERFVRGEFQLHPDQGAAVLAAIDNRVPDTTPLHRWDHASALALVELATSSANAPTSGPASTIQVSVDAGLLTPASEGTGVLADGSAVDSDAALRLACDARLQALYKGPDGATVAIGATTRSVPGWLRRAVEERDRGRCTFPGCGRDRYLHCHHRIHYAAGGPTTISNLQLVCFEHHRLLHEGGWALSGEAGPRSEWLRPDGSRFEPRVRVTLDTS